MSRTIAITENNGTGKTLVYRKALKLEEQAEKEFHTGNFQSYGRSKL
ncbi:MAG: hypothetical protein O2V44_02355 [Candidatus Bathyarchaeota archaeon]|nr:hypothetical protein [Candidatus Bathyarchaeota archaeon]